MIRDHAMQQALLERLEWVSQICTRVAEAVGETERPDLERQLDALCGELAMFVDEMTSIETTAAPSGNTSGQPEESSDVSSDLPSLIRRMSSELEALASAYAMALRADISPAFRAFLDHQSRRVVVAQRRVEHIEMVVNA